MPLLSHRQARLIRRDYLSASAARGVVHDQAAKAGRAASAISTSAPVEDMDDFAQNERAESADRDVAIKTIKDWVVYTAAVEAVRVAAHRVASAVQNTLATVDTNTTLRERKQAHFDRAVRALGGLSEALSTLTRAQEVIDEVDVPSTRVEEYNLMTGVSASEMRETVTMAEVEAVDTAAGTAEQALRQLQYAVGGAIGRSVPWPTSGSDTEEEDTERAVRAAAAARAQQRAHLRAEAERRRAAARQRRLSDNRRWRPPTPHPHGGAEPPDASALAAQRKRKRVSRSRISQMLMMSMPETDDDDDEDDDDDVLTQLQVPLQPRPQPQPQPQPQSDDDDDGNATTQSQQSIEWNYNNSSDDDDDGTVELRIPSSYPEERAAAAAAEQGRKRQRNTSAGDATRLGPVGARAGECSACNCGSVGCECDVDALQRDLSRQNQENCAVM